MALSDLTRNAVDLLPAGGLEEKLKLGRPLRVKLGIDVTSPDIHVGRAVPLQRMRAFQDEGHTGVLIVGDYTTRIGDPSGRSAERPILSDEEIDRNAKTYLEQHPQLLDKLEAMILTKHKIKRGADASAPAAEPGKPESKPPTKADVAPDGKPVVRMAAPAAKNGAADDKRPATKPAN